MSRGKYKNINEGGSFSEVWERLLLETDIRTLSNLADIVGKTQPNISATKQKDFFPAGWAYLVAKKYGLLTEWIVSGEGPKRIDDRDGPFGDYLIQIKEWLSILIENEPNRKEWFECAFEDSFPLFKEWKKLQSK